MCACVCLCICVDGRPPYFVLERRRGVNTNKTQTEYDKNRCTDLSLGLRTRIGLRTR